ncbi:MAG: hypothetical protein F6K22_34795 [Okeania sp. SIO2F4]|uniref:hypothetical protein n=1 Tax=Okeania sp. SIO2F4 TaxID=2607790 RepID=UPI00142A5AF9|nr:hypothetical protein [Okeania sp. SIO2F4]MDJ0518046.1 hypothetical protein [Trichodesmium sp. MO_231.B1]NES07509.1 hypothetical protein [Okeania sp. SIO2F4]
MNYHNNQNFKKNPEPNEGATSNSFNAVSNVGKSIQVFFAQFLEWFQTLPQWGKIIGLIIIPIFVIKILEAVVSLVSLLITIGVFAGVIYLGYRFLIPPNYSEQDK